MTQGIYLGVVLSALNSVLSACALRWAFTRSDKVFFGAFVCGILWKLGVLGALVLGTSRELFSYRASALVSLALSSLFLNLAEIRFLPNKHTPRSL